MTDNTAEQKSEPTELALLKTRATQMGISFHPKIGVVKLKDKIELTLKGQNAPIEVTPKIVMPKIETAVTKRESAYKEASRLVRIRVNCMNPLKKEYEGDIFTISNSVVGTFKKFVPYNNEEGWHVPNIIVEHLKERQCQVFYTVKGPRGNKIRKGKLIKEFAIEILDPLTGDELHELAQRQAMANNLD